MPFEDVVGNTGTVLPAQIVSVGPKLNAGVTIGFTVTVKVVFNMHWPGITVGVKVYTPEAWLSTIAGLHVPSTPLSDVFGNVGTVPPIQMLRFFPKLNV